MIGRCRSRGIWPKAFKYTCGFALAVPASIKVNFVFMPDFFSWTGDKTGKIADRSN